ncbi:MAG: SRPBCC family protein [Actinomycetota bacterium]
MSVDVSTSIVIGRPRGEVFAYASDLDRSTAWYRNISAVRWLTAKPLEIGSRVTFTARFLGRTLTYTYEVHDLVPEERLVLRTEQGPFPMETTYTWEEDAEDLTRMTLRNRGEPSGFANVTAPAMVRAMRRANRKDLEQLKRLIEAEGR